MSWSRLLFVAFVTLVAGCTSAVEGPTDEAQDVRVVVAASAAPTDLGDLDPEPGGNSASCSRNPRRCCDTNNAGKCVKWVAGCQACP
jgi:hypothetical protein